MISYERREEGRRQGEKLDFSEYNILLLYWEPLNII